MTPAEIDLLESVFAKTEAVISGVKPEHVHRASPCPEFEVARLVDHLVGWASSFAARATGASFEGNPNDFRAGADAAAEFHEATGSILRACRAGDEGAQKLSAGMLLMEYIVHGWDLAIATGQPTEFTVAEAEHALDAGKAMLKPEYRGPGMAFGPEAPVADDAGSLLRLVAFLGRDPGWRAVRI